MKVLALLFAIFAYTSYSLANDVINFPWSGNTYSLTEAYYEAVLKLALNKSEDKYGPYTVNKVEAGASQEHIIRLVQEDRFVNLYWTVTSIKREQRLLPVRFPLFKGLFGCRISLIKKGQQPRFDQIDNIEQLKLLHAGQGKDWPDSSILQSNQFKLTTSTEDESLFVMLAKERFDYFPRALHEARAEIDQYPELTIEKRFLIYYDSPFFFFVNKVNQRLAERLAYGLQQSVQDGSFDQLFNTHPVSANILQQFNLQNRDVILLDNPQISEESKALLKKMATRDNCLGTQDPRH